MCSFHPKIYFNSCEVGHLFTGITLNTLWVRLKERPDFKLELEDASKNYLWNCILSLKDVEYYELKEDRPDLVPYNRFHYYDPETGHFLETVSIRYCVLNLILRIRRGNRDNPGIIFYIFP